MACTRFKSLAQLIITSTWRMRRGRSSWGAPRPSRSARRSSCRTRAMLRRWLRALNLNQTPLTRASSSSSPNSKGKSTLKRFWPSWSSTRTIWHRGRRSPPKVSIIDWLMKLTLSICLATLTTLSLLSWWRVAARTCPSYFPKTLSICHRPIFGTAVGESRSKWACQCLTSWNILGRGLLLARSSDQRI